jgi:peptidoglycan/xylan/chitin deacetylase (PgdA/CDA1 family)
MQSVRLLFLGTACVCLVALATSCGGGADSAEGLATTPDVSLTSAAGKGTPGTPAVSTPEPPPDSYYIVEFGDTLGTIAERVGVSMSRLASLNQITDTEKIFAGQRLLLPPGVVMPTVVPVRIDNVRVPILLYHHIASLMESAGSEWYVTTVTPEAFDEQMAYLAYNGYHTVKVMDLLDALDGRTVLPPNPVVITFDDGWIDGYEGAFPVLQRYGMIASFFISAQWIGGGNSEVMSWAQIQELSRAGMEIGSHTMTHPYLTQLDPDEMAWELQESKALLEEHLGEPVEVLAYPFGIYDSNVMIQTQAAGYRAALSIEEGQFDSSDNLFDLPRLIPLYGDSMDTFVAMLGASD